jgi:phosphatidylglycerol---prolipoprotein diacylglyceryl transferase
MSASAANDLVVRVNSATDLSKSISFPFVAGAPRGQLASRLRMTLVQRFFSVRDEPASTFRLVVLTLPYPRIPPEIFRVGPLAVRWYGVMYIIGFVVGTHLSKQRARRGLISLDDRGIDAWIGYLIVGLLIGARLTYILVYDPRHYANDPWDMIAIWHGGLSFHGAILGMGIASLIFARRHKLPFWSVTDTMAYAGTPGLFFGRLGNFINGELYGRPSTVPWSMVFPSDPARMPRHPSQLYEAFGEGLILFFALRTLERRAVRHGWYRPGLLSGAFLVGYGIIRFLIEFTRQPDVQLGLVAGPFSMGQLLSGLMIAAGALILVTTTRQSAV